MQAYSDIINEMLRALEQAYNDLNAPLESRNAALYIDKNADALVFFGKDDPVAFEDIINKIKDITGLSLASIKKHVEKRLMENEQNDIKEPEIDPSILAEANKILDEGKGFEYVSGLAEETPRR